LGQAKTESAAHGQLTSADPGFLPSSRRHLLGRACTGLRLLRAWVILRLPGWQRFSQDPKALSPGFSRSRCRPSESSPLGYSGQDLARRFPFVSRTGLNFLFLRLRPASFTKAPAVRRPLPRIPRLEVSWYSTAPRNRIKLFSQLWLRPKSWCSGS